MFGARYGRDTVGLVCGDNLDTQTPAWTNNSSFFNCKLPNNLCKEVTSPTHQTVACIVTRRGERKQAAAIRQHFSSLETSWGLGNIHKLRRKYIFHFSMCRVILWIYETPMFEVPRAGCTKWAYNKNLNEKKKNEKKKAGYKCKVRKWHVWLSDTHFKNRCQKQVETQT